MSIKLSSKVNPIRINSRSSTPAKSNGARFQLITDKGIPTVQWSVLVSGVEHCYSVATLSGLTLEINQQNINAIANRHDMRLTDKKIQSFLNSILNKETLASLKHDGLLTDAAIQDYLKVLVTNAEVDLGDSSLEDCILQTMIQSSRQAVFAGSNTALEKMLSKLSDEDEQRLRAKVDEYIKANPGIMAIAGKAEPKQIEAKKSKTKKSQPKKEVITEITEELVTA